MDLKDFVTQSLLQIVGGVKEAQRQLLADNGNDARINPKPASWPSGSHATMDERTIQKVAFDVAVTASSEAEAKAGAGVIVAAIGLGAHGRQSTENTAVSRIQFEVGIALPSWPDRKPAQPPDPLVRSAPCMKVGRWTTSESPSQAAREEAAL